MFFSAAPVASANDTVTVGVGDSLELMANISDFNLALDAINWTHNTSALVNGMDRISIVNSDFNPSSASSTLMRSDLAGVSDSGTYTVTASNRAGSSTTTFTVRVTGKKNLFSVYLGSTLYSIFIQNHLTS